MEHQLSADLRPRAWGPASRSTQQTLRDRIELHESRALVDLGHLRVAQELLRGTILGDADATIDVDTAARDRFCDPTRDDYTLRI